MKIALSIKQQMTKKNAKKIAVSGLGLATRVALHYGPAGIIGWLLRFINSKPLRWFILMVISPILTAIIARLARLLPWEKHETTAK